MTDATIPEIMVGMYTEVLTKLAILEPRPLTILANRKARISVDGTTIKANLSPTITASPNNRSVITI
jgi:hypothetical protein